MQAVDSSTVVEAPETGDRWWLEWEAYFLIVLVIAAYWLRLGDLPIRGEESRWATVAKEMMASGDWVVPRQQGEPFLSRPPLGSWLMAAAALLRGQFDLLAARLPTVSAILAITLLIYAYGRQFLSRLGALAAAAAFATMGHVQEIGRLAESDTVFTLCISGSLLIWHWNITAGRWSLAWVAGYGLAALGALAKGPQAPVYFAAVTGVYLIVSGRGRWLLGRAHFLGLATFALLISIWLLPFYWDLGPAAVQQVWLGDTNLRLVERSMAARLIHLAQYPFEVMACTLPWSPLLLALAIRGVWRGTDRAQSAMAFLAVALIVTFPTCWLVAGARGRYFMPLYPCLALLIGCVVDHGAQAKPAALLQLGWSCYLALLAGVMILLASLVAWATVSALPMLEWFAQPPVFALAYSMAALAAAVIVIQAVRRPPAPASVLAIALFTALTLSGAALNTMVRLSDDTEAQVARLKQLLPPDARLVSLGPVHHQFAYYYGAPIPQVDPANSECLREDDYFCLLKEQVPPATDWELVAVILHGRYRSRQHQFITVVGRRGGKPTEGPGMSEDRLTSEWPWHGH